MKNKLIILVLILIIGLLGGYVCYDKLIINQKNNDCLYNKNECDNGEYDENTVVLSAYEGIKRFHVKKDDSACENRDFDLIHRISIPKIVKNTKNANSFNEKIYDTYKGYIEKLKNDNLIVNEGAASIIVDYDYNVVDNIVYIVINIRIATSCAGSTEGVIGYYYDLKNDKELTLEEVYMKHSITLDDISSELKKRYPESVNSIEELQPIIPTLYYYESESYIIYLNDVFVEVVEMSFDKR